MPLARRSLKEAAAARFGWRTAYDTTTEVNTALTEQTETAYAQAAHHAQLATNKNHDALAVQPGVLDVRGRVLADVLYLEGLLVGARHRGLPAELIERIEDAVDHGHELAVLLADAVRTTAALHTAGR
ncbi:hypothetical protein [Streptomyces sp. NPDC006638]|uniref:hypothetical protein n=1 Tax=Streptomyces sp. NPDC006638 TaxID=3157183 RepID=UPI0033BA965E